MEDYSEVFDITRQHGVSDKMAKLALGMLFGIDAKEAYPIVATLLINIVQPKLDLEDTDFYDIETYHYGFTELLAGCAIGIHLGVLKTHHVRKIINDCWRYPYVGYSLIQYLNETKILDEIDGSVLDAAITKVMAENAAVCDNVRKGNDKAIGALVGKVLKEHKADPATVKNMLFDKIRA